MCDLFDYASFYVGVLSVLVTVLIGWQIANYFYVEHRLNKMLNRKIEEFTSVMNGTIRLSLYSNAMTGGCAHLIRNCFDALHTALKSDDKNLRNSAINAILDILNDLCVEYKDTPQIYKGMSGMYISILADINDHRTAGIKDFIEHAAEVPVEEKHIHVLDQMTDDDLNSCIDISTCSNNAPKAEEKNEEKQEEHVSRP